MSLSPPPQLLKCKEMVAFVRSTLTAAKDFITLLQSEDAAEVAGMVLDLGRSVIAAAKSEEAARATKSVIGLGEFVARKKEKEEEL